MGDRITLYGNGGAGKTVASTTALKAVQANGGRLIYLITEANSFTSITKGLKIHGLVPKEGQLFFKIVKKKAKSFDNLLRSMEAYQTVSKVASLKGNVNSTQGKENYTGFMDIFSNFGKFIAEDYVTGQQVNLGHVGNFTNKDVLVIDGLSPINHEIWMATAGDKIDLAMGDYMPAQTVMNRIMLDIQDLTCNVILLAHETTLGDVETSAGFTSAVQTGVGVKTYHSIMGCFSEVIHVVKKAGKYSFELAGNKIFTVTRKMEAATPIVAADLSQFSELFDGE